MLHFVVIALISGGIASSAGITLWYGYKTYVTNRHTRGYIQIPPIIDIIPNIRNPTIHRVDYNSLRLRPNSIPIPIPIPRPSNILERNEDVPPKYEDIDLI